jgi:hypothetical protein
VDETDPSILNPQLLQIKQDVSHILLFISLQLTQRMFELDAFYDLYLDDPRAPFIEKLRIKLKKALQYKPTKRRV